MFFRRRHNFYGIKILHEAVNQQQPTADIVFVHGLNGGIETSWTVNKGARVNWPSTLLCEDVPDVRISAFGYDATPVGFWGPVSQNRIGGHAMNLLGDLARMRADSKTDNVKIIFVAHSLGGLVVEEALAAAKGSTQIHLQLLESRTIGLCFLGTPHFGSSLAQWGKLAAKLARAFPTNANIVSVLGSKSEVLSGIQDRFYNVLNHRIKEGSAIEITCFYEELSMLIGGIVVPERDATLPGYGRYGIHANHADMAKFESRSDTGYVKIVGELQRWIRAKDLSSSQTDQLTSEQEECLRSLHYPEMTVRQETAREAVSGTLDWVWQPEKSSLTTWTRSGSGVFWITGKPGSGKTTAMKYIVGNRDRMQLESNTTIISHFFDHGGSQLANSTNGLFRSMLFQSLQADPRLFRFALPRYAAMKRTHSAISWSTKKLRELLEEILQWLEMKPLSIFIDAVDEASGDIEVLAKDIIHLSNLGPGHVQFCISSRPLADLSFYFTNPTYQLILGKNQAHDVHEYINGSFRELSSFVDIDYSSLVAQVSAEAEDNFLWARLVVEDLLRAARRKQPIQQLHDRLRLMPKELNAYYQRMLDQASKNEIDRETALQLLSIVLAAKEQLEIAQFMDILDHCVEPVPGRMDLPQMKISFHRKVGSVEDFEHFILSTCFGLIDVRHVHRPRGTTKVVTFTHHTVREFLYKLDTTRCETTGCWEMAGRGSIDLLKACVYCISAVYHSEHFATSEVDEGHHWRGITQTKVTKVRVIEGSPGEDDTTWVTAELDLKVFADCPLLTYAVSHWAEHAQGVEVLTQQSCRPFIIGLAAMNLRLWRLLTRGHNNTVIVGGRDIITPVTLLETGILFGLRRYVAEEIQLRFASTNAIVAEFGEHFHTYYGRLLYAAASAGYCDISECICVWSARLIPQSQYASDAIARATYRENHGTTRILLDHGAAFIPDTGGIFLEGFDVRWHYKTANRLVVHLSSDPVHLKGYPRDPPPAHSYHYQKYELFDADGKEPIDHLGELAKWDSRIATDDFEVSPLSSVRSAHTNPRLGRCGPYSTWSQGPTLTILNEDILIDRQPGSMRIHYITVQLVAQADIDAQLDQIRKYQAAYDRLPILDVTPFSRESPESIPLTGKLLELGYTRAEYLSQTDYLIGSLSLEDHVGVIVGRLMERYRFDDDDDGNEDAHDNFEDEYEDDSDETS